MSGSQPTEAELELLLSRHEQWLASLSRPGGPWGERASLRRANLQGVCLKSANLREADLREANLDGADLSDAHVVKADLAGATLEKADLLRANLGGANLKRANCRNANLEGADLDRTNLERANLFRANLQGASLVRSNLLRANLEKAILVRAKLQGTGLREANLQGVDLREANLVAAELIRADLRDAEIESLNCDGASLTHVALNSDADLVTDAIWDELYIDGVVFRRDELHIRPLPFGMGRSFALNLPFSGLSKDQLQLLCRIADAILAAGTMSMVVHLGGDDRLETRAYGPGREDQVLAAVAKQQHLLEQLADKLDRPAWLGPVGEELKRLRPRLESTFNMLVAAQDETEIEKAKRQPGMELAKAHAPKLLSKLLRSLGA